MHLLRGAGHALPEKNFTNSNFSPHYFFFIVSFMILIVGASLVALILTLPSLNPYSQSQALVVVFALLLALVANIYIAIKDVTKRSLTHRKFKFIPCHRGLKILGREFILCSRCLGFYFGTIFWGVLTSMNHLIWVNLLKSIGTIWFVLLLAAVISTVPIHGAWLRIHPSRNRIQNVSRSIIGFIFSSSIWLVAGLIIYYLA